AAMISGPSFRICVNPVPSSRTPTSFCSCIARNTTTRCANRWNLTVRSSRSGWQKPTRSTARLKSSSASNVTARPEPLNCSSMPPGPGSPPLPETCACPTECKGLRLPHGRTASGQVNPIAMAETALQSNLPPESPGLPDWHRFVPEAGGVLTINLDAVVANWQDLGRHAMPSECAAVIKADGYGCGI